MGLSLSDNLVLTSNCASFLYHLLYCEASFDQPLLYQLSYEAVGVITAKVEDGFLCHLWSPTPLLGLTLNGKLLSPL